MFVDIFYWLFNRKEYLRRKKEYLDSRHVNSFGQRVKKPFKYSEKEIEMARKIVADGNRREAERKASKKRGSSSDHDYDDGGCSGSSTNSSGFDD